MKTYHFTSPKFKGYIKFTYNTNGLLQQYDSTQAQLNTTQAEWLVTNLPKTYNTMRQLIATNSDMKLSPPLLTNVTFEQFWPIVYLNKGSSKKLSHKLWEKMPQAERDKAANHWPIYLRNKNDGEGVKYVETYLRSEIWNN